MGMTRTINIDGKDVAFKASAAIPRIYRLKFGRDIYKDMASLETSVDENNEEASSLDSFSLVTGNVILSVLKCFRKLFEETFLLRLLNVR